jgi:hypothetical protein
MWNTRLWGALEELVNIQAELTRWSRLRSHRCSVSDMPVSSNLANCSGRHGRLK